MTTIPDHTVVDLRGAIIPLALLKVSQVFRETKAGKIMEFLVNDPDTKRDIFKILPPFSYRLTDMNDEGSFYRIRLIRER